MTNERPIEPTEILPRQFVAGPGSRSTRISAGNTLPLLRSKPGSLLRSTAAVGSFLAGGIVAAAVSGGLRGMAGLVRLVGARPAVVRPLPTESVLHVSSGLAILSDSLRVSWVHIEMRTTR